MNIGYYTVIILTIIGTFVPLIGLVLLYYREHNRATMCLMITNIGALIMNAGYLLLLQARTYNEALALYKLMFLGNPLFYIFFIRFVCSFYKDKT
ncbi:MAG: hypothetical protein J6Z02_05100, partial [Lachnospiraceae bacterium]|nr:hypothetical protein [Lachnospiraceae bacterium]